MTRALDVLQLTFYVVAIVLLVLVGSHATVVLKELSDGLKVDRLHHEQLLKEHQQQLKDHERQMERR